MDVMSTDAYKSRVLDAFVNGGRHAWSVNWWFTIAAGVDEDVATHS